MMVWMMGGFGGMGFAIGGVLGVDHLDSIALVCFVRWRGIPSALDAQRHMLRRNQQTGKI
jgi:hypothetical protein